MPFSSSLRRGARAFREFTHDLSLAVRVLRRRPGFTTIVVLTLAIGIGATVAIFSAVDAMLLRRLPFREPDRLITVNLVMPDQEESAWSLPKSIVFRDAQTVFEDLTLYGEWQATVRGDGAERVRGELADAHYLPTLGVRPALGRNFAAEEARTVGGPKVVLLGDALWRRRFAADSGVVGRVIDVGGGRYTIIGVLPPGFRGLTGRAELWTPIVVGEPTMANEAWFHSFTLVGRLKRGVSPEQANGHAKQLGRGVDEAYPSPEKTEHWSATVRELDASRVDPVVRRALLVLMVAVGLVHLIACANVANLLLVRATARQDELAIRVALGAGRGRLVRQLLTENALLSALGGTLGVAVAWWGTRLLSTLDPTRAPRLRTLTGLGVVSFDQSRIDGAALAFTAAIVLGTTLVFGLVPAFQATALAPGARLRRRRATRAHAVLAVAEVALAVVLLAGAGLMLRSLGNLLAVRQGFDAEGVITVSLGRPDELGDPLFPGYHDGDGDQQLTVFYDQVLERVAGIPGVTGVALQDCLPLSGNCSNTVIQLMDRPRPPGGQRQEVGVHWITPDWPALMHVRVLKGRALTAVDRAGAPRVVLISEAAARRYWPGEDPIGKPVRVGVVNFDQDTARVVGVLADIRYGAADSLPRPDVYLSYQQMPDARVTMLVRTAGDPIALVPQLRRMVREIAPNVAVYDARTLVGRVRDATSLARLGAVLLTVFAVVAATLAAIGVYGVLSFAVTQRTHEIAMRLALGATPGMVVWLVVRRGLAIAGVGCVIGTAGALATTRVLRSLLYDVAPTDPATYAGIFTLVALAVILASWLPAHRAAILAPATVLRAE